MKVVIVEDELTASDNLQYLLAKMDANIEVLAVLDTVKSCVRYFSKPNEAALIFMDIHLADGISFEIFDHVNISQPIIFTTAYDEYALKAFAVNSIDYILKPVHQEELSTALEKYKNLTQAAAMVKTDFARVLDLLKEKKKQFKSNFLVAYQDELIPIRAADIAYFYIDTGIVKLITVQNKTYTLDKKLEELENELDPICFDRANRQCIINRTAVAKVKPYFGGKLVVQMNPPAKERIVISKAKARQFKMWLDS